MQHKRPRLMAKILAFVLAVSLVFPVSAFASVADLADDTRVPGKSLANTYPNLPVDWQVSLAEDTKDVTVRVPVSLTADELTNDMLLFFIDHVNVYSGMRVEIIYRFSDEIARLIGQENTAE